LGFYPAPQPYLTI